MSDTTISLKVAVKSPPRQTSFRLKSLLLTLLLVEGTQPVRGVASYPGSAPSIVVPEDAEKWDRQGLRCGCRSSWSPIQRMDADCRRMVLAMLSIGPE